MKKEKYYSISKKKILDFGIFIFVGLLLFIFISSFFSEMQAFFYTISGYVFLITFNKHFKIYHLGIRQYIGFLFLLVFLFSVFVNKVSLLPLTTKGSGTILNLIIGLGLFFIKIKPYDSKMKKE